MATTDNASIYNTGLGPATAGQRWYAHRPGPGGRPVSVSMSDAGLSAAEAAERSARRPERRFPR